MKSLLVIDIQERYMDHYDPELLNRVNSRILRAQEDGIPVLYARNIPRLESSENYDYAAGLLIISDHLYEKKSPSSFSDPAFGEDLKKLGVTEIEMIGADGNCCVKKTCIDAVSAGYKVVYNCDCIGARNSRIYAKTLEELEEKGVIILR